MPMTSNQTQPISQADDARWIIQRRNRLVLLALLGCVAVAFAISFYHITREARRPAANQQSHSGTEPRSALGMGSPNTASSR
jgi:hypothetical protein